MQKRAVRIITKSKYNASTLPLFGRSHVLQLEDIPKLELAKMMYNYSHKMLPEQLQTLFDSNDLIHEYSTRQATNPHIVSYHYKILYSSFLHQAPMIWSKVPFEIKNSPSKNSFGKKMKKHLLTK